MRTSFFEAGGEISIDRANQPRGRGARFVEGTVIALFSPFTLPILERPLFYTQYECKMKTPLLLSCRTWDARHHLEVADDRVWVKTAAHVLLLDRSLSESR